MFRCFITNCQSQYSSATELIHHLEEVHNVPETYTFPCTYPKCVLVVTKFYRYKRHLLSHKHQISSKQLAKQTVSSSSSVVPMQCESVPSTSRVEPMQCDFSVLENDTSFEQSIQKN
uniref:(northern house mosquito) hypothetical protein n=1 Tax=Culex pipiens TaxID=7175 RepID=A0A8D8G1Y8_CULPI